MICSIPSNTEELCPAKFRLYSLRNVEPVKINQYESDLMLVNSRLAEMF